MTAAFISFLAHHNVFPEPALHSAFKKAAAIARSGPAKLIRARELENILVRGTRWNRASWAVWGGSHSGPEPGGPEKESQWGSLSTEFQASEEKTKPENPDEAETGDSDEAGGWTVDESTSQIAVRRPIKANVSQSLTSALTRLPRKMVSDLYLFHQRTSADPKTFLTNSYQRCPFTYPALLN